MSQMTECWTHNVIVINVNSATMLHSLSGVVAVETILEHNINML